MNFWKKLKNSVNSQIIIEDVNNSKVNIKINGISEEKPIESPTREFKEENSAYSTGNKYSYNNVHSVSIINGIVKINGKVVDSPQSEKTINIIITGDIDVVDIDYCNDFNITGSANSVKVGSGNIKIGSVSGYVTSGSGNIKATSIGGSVKTGSGNVSSEGDIHGDVSTGSGNIKGKK